MKGLIDSKKNSPLFLFALFVSLFLYIWIFSQTPYGIDDWAWGIDYGMRALLTASKDSRYIGDLLVVIVTRSEFLKAVLLGVIAAAIPLCLVDLVQSSIRQEPSLSKEANNLPLVMLFLANILFLTLPMDVWKETYGWVAGFSNYGLSIFFLAVFQLLIFRAVFDNTREHSVIAGLGYFIFGICIQLVVENMSIYVFLADFIILVFLVLVRNNRSAKILILVMLCGNLIGLAIMFSSNIYDSLWNTGMALGGFRSLVIDKNDSIWSNFVLLNKRFVYFYPNRIFGNNWLICSMVSILLFIMCSKGKKWVKLVFRLFTFSFLLYFVFAHFFGPLENYIPRWNEVLTQRLNLLFFWGILCVILFFPWEGAYKRIILAFVWLSVPGVVLPCIAVKVVGSRYFLLSSFFLIEFCLFLFAEVYRHWLKWPRITDCLFLLAFVLVSMHRFFIYYDIGQGKKERDALIRAAQNGEIDRLYFPDLPHDEYIEYNEPLDGQIEVNYFREFFKIPDSVEMHNSLEDFSSPEE